MSQPATAPGDELLAAERIVAALLGVLRAGTLGLGVGETIGASQLVHRGAAVAALTALGGQSAGVFAVASRRLRRGTMPVLDGGVALVETLAACALWRWSPTRPRRRCARRRRLCVLVIAQDGARLSTAERASAYTNTLSYVPFFAVGARVWPAARRGRLDRGAAPAARPCRPSSRASPPRAGAYRTSHDVPKAILRELRRGALTTEQLRTWAAKFRDDLLVAMSSEERPPIDLRGELGALASAFASANDLRVDLDGLRPVPRDAPALIVEAARELLNNASYHAYGYPVTLSARCAGSSIEVTVHDDGPGVDR